MKTKLTLLTIFIVTQLFSQDYKKTYETTIRHTENYNGINVNVKFRTIYDVFFGEPTRSHIAKVQSYGNKVYVDGRGYTEQEIGSELFSKVKLSLIYVAYDIYEGPIKLSTYQTENLIGFDVKGSPDWDKMWPGISETKAKDLYKNGYILRNARLVKVSFSGIDAIRRTLKDKKEKEDKIQNLQNQINNLGNTKEDLNQKKQLYRELDRVDTDRDYTSEINNIDNQLKSLAEEEQRKKEEEERKEKEAEEKRLQEEADAEQEEKQQEEERKREEEERQREEEEAKREQERREEAERQKQERINNYRDRIERQQAENDALAASAAASSASVLYLLGGVIYDKMGLPAQDLYTGNNIHFGFDFGYGVSGFPLTINSVPEVLDSDGFPTTGDTDNKSVTAMTIDLRLQLKLGYEMEYAGGNLYGRFEPGFSPILTSFNLSYGYGLELFGGHKNVKLYGRYEFGNNSFSYNNWIDATELGEGGKTNTNFQQIRAGLKFSYYRNERTAKRDHIIIGVMENYFDDESASIFSIRNEPDAPLLNLLSTPYNGTAKENPYIATGYFFEWKRDHTHRLYLEIFPNYPVTGEIRGTTDTSGKFFIQAGFSRSIEGFFGL